MGYFGLPDVESQTLVEFRKVFPKKSPLGEGFHGGLQASCLHSHAFFFIAENPSGELAGTDAPEILPIRARVDEPGTAISAGDLINHVHDRLEAAFPLNHVFRAQIDPAIMGP